MTDSKRSGPVTVGFPPQPKGVENPAAAQYKQDVAERARQAEEARRAQQPIPDLNRAAAQHEVARDGNTTLGSLAMQQKAVDGIGGEAADPTKRVLSQGTLAGLAALQQEVGTQQPTAVPPQNETPTGASPNKMAAIMEQMDDLELEQMLRRSNKDLINNPEQQKLIDKLVTPLDLGEGLATGEFSQVVPIKKDVLTVKFRSVSPMENEEIRKIIFQMELDDKRLIGLTSERFSLMLCVASLVQLNGSRLPAHVTGTASQMVFHEDQFMRKYELVRRYPPALVHTLMTHSYWFNLRVNKLFVLDDIKNG